MNLKKYYKSVKKFQLQKEPNDEPRSFFSRIFSNTSFYLLAIFSYKHFSAENQAENVTDSPLSEKNSQADADLPPDKNFIFAQEYNEQVNEGLMTLGQGISPLQTQMVSSPILNFAPINVVYHPSILYSSSELVLGKGGNDFIISQTGVFTGEKIILTPGLLIDEIFVQILPAPVVNIEQIINVLPPSEPVSDIKPLFSSKSDEVDFNNLADISAALTKTTNLYEAGAGNDTVFLPNSSNAVKIGFDHTQTFSAGSGNDTIYGSELSDRIKGNTGHDILEGREGQDFLDGGEDGDRYVWREGDGADVISDTGAHGIDEIQIVSNTSALHQYIFSDNGSGVVQMDLTQNSQTTTLNFSGIESIDLSANNEAHQIIFDDLDNTAVNQVYIKLGNANDSVEMNADFLSSVMTTLSGSDGDDTLTLKGGGNVDAQSFAKISGFENITLTNEGNYKLALHDNVVASGERLTVDASALDASHTAIIDASQETDGAVDLIGGAGADILTGGSGDDTFIGGAGNDTFVFELGSGVDTIEDFHRSADGDSENDVLDLQAYNFTDMNDLLIFDSGNSVTIFLDNNFENQIVVEGIDDPSDLIASDFIF